MEDAIFGIPTLPLTLSDGKFALGQAVGSGAIAQVFKATEQATGEVVALKLMEVRAFDQSADTARFIAEAKVMGAMSHPRIARVFGVGKEQGFYWYAMQYLPGGSLRDLVTSEGPVTPRRALSLTADILDGLQFVHAQGILHRDIKSRNVMLDADGRAVLVDFGLAHHPEGTVPFKTRADAGMGSIGYSAPEQRARASDADERSDLFAVGATLAWLLTAERPDLFNLPDEDRPASLVEGFPAPVRDLLNKATAFEPADRYASATEMQQAVSRARISLGHVPERQGLWARMMVFFGAAY